MERGDKFNARGAPSAGIPQAVVKPHGQDGVAEALRHIFRPCGGELPTDLARLLDQLR